MFSSSLLQCFKSEAMDGEKGIEMVRRLKIKRSW